MVRLYREILGCDNPAERRQLLVDLGLEYALDADAFDMDTPEVIHELIDDVEHKRLALEQSAIRLGRAIFDNVGQASEAMEIMETVSADGKPN